MLGRSGSGCWPKPVLSGGSAADAGPKPGVSVRRSCMGGVWVREIDVKRGEGSEKG